MFGWELPPYNSGGLGTACLGLTEELVPRGVDVDFVIPEVFGSFPFSHMPVLSANDYTANPELSRFLALSPAQRAAITQSVGYGNTVVIDGHDRARVEHRRHSVPFTPQQQAGWYANQATAIAQNRDFDLIHCHEWMTYYCGIAAKQEAARQGRETPFVAQVHATEIDRGGAHGNKAIIDIERQGLQAADRVVAVSHYTKGIIHKHYDIPKAKISVVHNGISAKEPEHFSLHALKRHYKLVLFMGRITKSKGPEQFLKLAKAVTDRDDKVRFLMVGSGDMEKYCIEQAAAMGLTGKIIFSPFLRGEDVNRAYQMADLFIMPSVSEPFGLVALEALKNGTPAIVSKQSGVSEVSENLIKIDFWDTKAMEAAVFDMLYSPKKAAKLSHDAQTELRGLSWAKSAGQLQSIYTDLLSTLQPLGTPSHA